VMHRTCPGAARQVAAHDEAAFEDVWPSIRDRVVDTAKNGASFIVLPEGTIPAYVLGGADIEIGRVEKALSELRSLARKFHFLAVCGTVRAHGSQLLNSAVTIDTEGAVAGFSDKLFLWHFDRRWFSAGASIAPVRTTAGTFGVLICADGRMPQIARKLVDDGAQMLVMPTAWVTSGRDPAALENVQADLLARIRARENGVPLVAANKSGFERGCVAYCGKSQIVDAHGIVLAMGSQHNPDIVVADVTLASPRPRRIAVSIELTRRHPGEATVRVAITPFARDARTTLAVELLEAAELVAPDADDALKSLDRRIPTIAVEDDTVEDPGGLVPLRRNGYRVIVWNVGAADREWVEPLARSRALELRLYVIAIDRQQQRAFAVDPDGVVVAGTFGDLRVTSFGLDAARTNATLLAPGTDVEGGLELIASLIDQERR